jgi:hypothetical protein
MFYVLALALMAWIAINIYATGPRAGLWAGWLTALLLLPSWACIQLGALTVDMRTVAALTGLAALALFHTPGPRYRWLAADAVIVALIVVQVVSEYASGSTAVLAVPEICRKWLLPYVVGRWFLGSEADVSRVLPYAVMALLMLSLYALLEAITRINPINEIFGRYYGILEQGEGYRWGLKRAQAFFNHPIYLGYLLVLVLPWVLLARWRTNRGEGVWWWKHVPLVVAVALICTGSRGPIIAGLVAACTPVLVARPRWRIPALTLALVIAGSALLFRDTAVAGLTSLAGENHADPFTVVIGDEEVDYTGTNHRLLLFQVYADELAEVGYLGNGSELNNIDFDAHPSRFGSIDNHYLLFLLQHGWIAVGLFVLLAIAALVNLGQVVWQSSPPLSGFAAALFAVMAMVTAMLSFVWFSPDFGAAWLFSAGLAANLKSLKRSNENEKAVGSAGGNP